MLRVLLRLLAVALPLLPFAFAAQMAMDTMSSGSTANGILILLASLAVLALVEGLIFRIWILPAWGQAIGEHLYGGSYLPEEDAIARLAAQIRRSEDASLLPNMRQLVLEQKRRSRGWLELARLLQDVAHDDSAALQALLDGAEAVTDREDRAMLLYRAGSLAADKLNSPAEAAELFSRAANFLPNTVYGKRAAAKLPQAD